MASSTGFQLFGGTIWIVGHSITRAPMPSSRVRNSADWEAARVIKMVLPVSCMGVANEGLGLFLRAEQSPQVFQRHPVKAISLRVASLIQELAPEIPTNHP